MLTKWGHMWTVEEVGKESSARKEKEQVQMVISQMQSFGMLETQNMEENGSGE